MAAYPYYPVSYGNPYNTYYPQSYQPMVQPQVVQTPQVQPQVPVSNQAPTASGIIWVSGLAEAQAYPVAPNAAVALWEQSGKSIYLKSADATGKPSLRVYDLVERTETASAASASSDEKLPDFATKDDVATLAGAMKKALDDIELIKSDMYGIAGKKKPVKKTEATEDDA